MKVAVIYYSATGTVHGLAQAVAEGAGAGGAAVRLRRVAELAPDSAIDENPRWRQHADAAASVAQASVEDLAWANAFAFGTPTRFGAPAAQLKQFNDQAGGLWREGGLTDKPVTAFTSATHRHGGNEATILSLSNVFYHWGALIVPPGFTDPVVSAAGGNPYGASYVTGSYSPVTRPPARSRLVTWASRRPWYRAAASAAASGPRPADEPVTYDAP